MKCVSLFSLHVLVYGTVGGKLTSKWNLFHLWDIITFHFFMNKKNPEIIESVQCHFGGFSSQIKSWGMRLMRIKGRRRAVVAVARKLAVLLHRMWMDGTEFRQENVEGMAWAKQATRPTWRGRPHRTRFVEEAENDCCASWSASQSKVLHCRSDICLQRCHKGIQDCEEKRDPDEWQWPE